MKKANVQDMNMMLDGMLIPGDMYNVKVFAQVMPTSLAYYLTLNGGLLGAMIAGLFQEEFGSARAHNAYLGFTNNVMNFAVLDDFHADQLALTRTYNLADITKVRCNSTKRSLTVTVWFGKRKIRFMIRNKVRRTDFLQQDDCIAVIKDYFDQLSTMLKDRKKAA